MIYKMKDAVRRLGISRWTLARAAKRGDIPYHKYPGTNRIYFTRQDMAEIEFQLVGEAHGERDENAGRHLARKG